MEVLIAATLLIVCAVSGFLGGAACSAGDRGWMVVLFAISLISAEMLRHLG